jgi:tetratricopeptide (TPR) repeat protein/CHAT domain-containing protein
MGIRTINKIFFYNLPMKKLTTLLILLLCSLSNVLSQTYEELNQKLMEYYKKGEYATSIDYAEKAKIQAEKEFGKEHNNYAESLNNLAMLFKEMGAYDKAEPLFIESMDIYKKTLGPNNPEYATALNNLATFYFDLGKYDKAEPLFIESSAIRKKSLGQNHPSYAQSLNNLAMFYKKLGNYPKAEPLLGEALNSLKESLGSDHPSVAISMNNLAELYCDMSEYSKAEPLFIEALAIKKKSLGPDHPSNVMTLNNLANLYYKMGNYTKAEPLYIESLSILIKSLGSEHPLYALTLNNLASLYDQLGNYSQAERLYLEALNIRKRSLGLDHPDYAQSLNNMASLYLKIGNYEKAEPLFIQSLDIRKRSLGPAHPDYAQSLSNLAMFYNTVGNIQAAEQIFIESTNILKKSLGPNHPEYATALNNLALFYSEIGNYQKAEPLFIEASAIEKRVLGPDHVRYALSLNNLAGLYDKLGNYSKAESLFIEASAILKKVSGSYHPNYALSLNNLAALYGDLGNYTKAEQFYKEALNIREKSLGPNHPDYGVSLTNLAILYSRIEQYEKAEPLFIKANDNLNNQINKNFNFLSEVEREQFLENNVTYNFELLNSFILSRKEQNPLLAAISYDNELAHKGMLLSSNMALRQAIYDSSDSTLINTYDQFTDIHKKLSVLYTTPIAERKEDIDSMENAANKFEKELIIRGKDLPGVGNLTGLTNIKWKDVQQALKPGEVAVEFVDFQYYNRRWTDSTYYCALVLRKDYQYPKMIYLFEEKKLQELLSKPQATNNAYYITQLYSNKPDLPSVENQLSAQNILYQLIWRPIDSLLKGLNIIYIAPSGLLNKVAFNAIPMTDSTLLSDKYQINMVSSTRILAQKNRATVSFSGNYNAALYGGIEYDMDSTEMVASATRYEKSNNNMLTSRSVTIPAPDRGTTWLYLPGTFTEVSNIEKLFKTKLITYSLFTGKNATEESFKHLTDKNKSPDILHFATHGFFFPEIKPKLDDMANVAFRGGISNEPVFTYSENPLFRSGILLAGASRTWKNSQPILGIEDGILTAHEVSNINLSNTKLVVLSACETGLGDIKGSEGVYGLQRAFKMAGVQYIVMSLWQVPDYQTSELMLLFYTNCLNGMTIKDGFITAQQSLRKKYDPFYWAAFVLIE